MPTSNSLLDVTLALMKQAKDRGITQLEMYNSTHLSPYWLSAFANGKIADPSVRRVQRLHDYLAGVVA